MYPVGSCLHVLSDAFVHVCRRFLVGPVSECLEAFVFFERYQACWISQWILRNRQHVLQADSLPEKGLLPLDLSLRSSFPQKTPSRPRRVAPMRREIQSLDHRGVFVLIFSPESKGEENTQCLRCQGIHDADGRKNDQRSGCEKILNTVSKIERSKAPFPELFLHKNRFGTVFA